MRLSIALALIFFAPPVLACPTSEIPAAIEIFPDTGDLAPPNTLVRVRIPAGWERVYFPGEPSWPLADVAIFLRKMSDGSDALLYDSERSDERVENATLIATRPTSPLVGGESYEVVMRLGNGKETVIGEIAIGDTHARLDVELRSAKFHRTTVPKGLPFSVCQMHELPSVCGTLAFPYSYADLDLTKLSHAPIAFWMKPAGEPIDYAQPPTDIRWPSGFSSLRFLFVDTMWSGRPCAATPERLVDPSAVRVGVRAVQYDGAFGPVHQKIARVERASERKTASLFGTCNDDVRPSGANTPRLRRLRASIERAIAKGRDQLALDECYLAREEGACFRTFSLPLCETIANRMENR